MESYLIRRVLFSSDDSDDELLPSRRKKEFRPRINFETLIGWEFKERFRLRTEEAENLVAKIGPRIQLIQHTTTKNVALTPEKQILTTLHFLGNGGQLHGVGDMHGVSKATVCRCIKRVINAIVSDMFDDYVRWPSNPQNVAEEFLQIGGFPSVVGLVDGTLIKINAPKENEEQFVDRKGNHSINAMMVCGPDHTFYYCNARFPGAVQDQRVLRNPSMFQRFNNGWRPFYNAIILGASGYKSSNWLITPIADNPDDPRERRFNRYHKSTRRIVECAYGILKARFPCLKHTPCYAEKIIMACVVLHNLASNEDFLGENANDEDDKDTNPYFEDGNQSVNVEQRINELLNSFNY